MLIYNIKSITSIFFVLLLITIIPACLPQPQIRKREYIDSVQADANGYWYHYAYYQFETRFPVLKTIPPLSSDMDSETTMIYNSLDSLMRSTNRDSLYDKYLTRWNKTRQKNDSIVQLVKYLYKLTDFDPVRFNQYAHSLSSKYYSIKLGTLTGMVARLFSYIILNTPRQVVMDDLNRSDYILRVRVNFINVLPRISYSNKRIDSNEYIYKVNATVLDTLKGRVFNQCSNGQESSNICFNYGTGPYANDVIPFKVDPTLLNSDRNLTLKPGQELIVCLDYGNYLWDYNYDYFDLSIISAIPVINGKVSDISHIWSKSTLLEYSDWREIFTKTKEMLLNGEY